MIRTALIMIVPKLPMIHAIIENLPSLYQSIHLFFVCRKTPVLEAFAGIDNYGLAIFSFLFVVSLVASLYGLSSI